MSAPARPGAFLLTPGAGSSRDHPTLVAVEAAAGLASARIDFWYRREGRRSPDRAPKLVACVVQEAAALAAAAGLAPDEVVLGGRSMGGRICSMAVAEGLPAAGLVLISYPLHPPGRPDRLRVEHFGHLHVPCLFVSGTGDAFATPAELCEHTATIPGPVTHVFVDGAGHELKGRDAEVAGAVSRWLSSLAPPAGPRSAEPRSAEPG